MIIPRLSLGSEWGWSDKDIALAVELSATIWHYLAGSEPRLLTLEEMAQGMKEYKEKCHLGDKDIIVILAREELLPSLRELRLKALFVA